jgi:hypothetical protein
LISPGIPSDGQHPQRSASAWTEHYRRNKSRINQLAESTRLVTSSASQPDQPSGSQSNPAVLDDGDMDEEEEEEEEEEIEVVARPNGAQGGEVIVIDD